MGKRKHRDKAEREARELRRIARSNASNMRRMLLDAGVPPEDIVSLNAEGFVGKHAHVTGTPENWHNLPDVPDNYVAPPCQDEGHDDTTNTANL